ncbi:MAG: rod shape-determining protein RodA [Verrucomicrobia bacterium]|nr:rod shape-determining protein RodA [Verrucomicrobiota bacterium]MBS0636196.1 rod shape-determining protein RodA [Verrucomicrobiota bacterium]
MWSSKYFTRIDFRAVFVIFILMAVSLLIISSYSSNLTSDYIEEPFFTPMVKTQIQWFAIGWVVFFFFAGFDYNKLREWAWVLYVASIISLIGLFFVEAIQNVHRWYRLPFISHNFQPSEYAKLALVIALSWFLERKALSSRSLSTALGALLIFIIPFVCILKQPDLGTALVLYPMTLVMFYFGDMAPWLVRAMLGAALGAVFVVFLFFSGILSHEESRPYFLKVIKEYQYERLNPNTHHQKAAATAVAIGGLTGVGFKESEYTRGGSLPVPYTDSAFPAFGEEFGFIGLVFLLLLFYGLIYCSFQVSAVAKDAFGRLLAAGIAVFLAVHITVNIGMMCGILPITGVPLVLVSYGGSSVLSTMMALGILQSIYSRRFMF